MKVFMVGGTGLLGSEAARELIRRGHEVSSIALPPLPEGEVLPPEMTIDFANYMELSDDELRGYLEGMDGLVFAAGVDERMEGPPPIYDLFEKYNIAPLKRLLRIAKESGVKHAVICGSYFAYFDRAWPKMELYKHHPYIRSRVDQANMALSFADDDFDVAVLELPYIFGTQPGRKPVWVFLVEQIRNMEKRTMYPKGGTTMVTVKQVAETIAGALEKNKGGHNIPVGYYNLEWIQLISIIHRFMGTPEKKIVTIPTFLFKLGLKSTIKKQKQENLEPGLNMKYFPKLMTSKAFIDKKWIEALGVGPDDIDGAIGESVLLSLEILDGKTKTVDMKGE